MDLEYMWRPLSPPVIPLEHPYYRRADGLNASPYLWQTVAAGSYERPKSPQPLCISLKEIDPGYGLPKTQEEWTYYPLSLDDLSDPEPSESESDFDSESESESESSSRATSPTPSFSDIEDDAIPTYRAAPSARPSARPYSKRKPLPHLARKKKVKSKTTVGGQLDSGRVLLSYQAFNTKGNMSCHRDSTSLMVTSSGPFTSFQGLPYIVVFRSTVATASAGGRAGSRLPPHWYLPMFGHIGGYPEYDEAAHNNVFKEATFIRALIPLRRGGEIPWSGSWLRRSFSEALEASRTWRGHKLGKKNDQEPCGNPNMKSVQSSSEPQSQLRLYYNDDYNEPYSEPYSALSTDFNPPPHSTISWSPYPKAEIWREKAARMKMPLHSTESKEP
ncbi:hypothetical protein V8D89_002443 [Ganoderma adspersum]